MARNERLVSAMHTAGLSPVELARRVEVDDPKTVQRWVSARQRPHRATAQLVAKEVGVPVGVLWPELGVRSAFPAELVHVYTSRRELQAAYIESLLRGATEGIDVLAYSATWLWDSVPGITDRLVQAVRRKCRVRICLGDPGSPAVALRGAEEGIGAAMAGRCELALSYASKIAKDFPDVVRLHGTTLYASVFRFDEDMLINWHIYGVPAADAPVFHFRLSAQERGSMANTLAAAYDAVWESSVVYRLDEDANPG